MTCEDCLYRLVCEDYQHSGCCDADNCFDFKSATSVISVKRNIGDLLYEPEKRHVAIYKVTAVHILSTGIHYEIATVRGESNRTSVCDAEIGDTVFITYHEAEKRVRQSSICFECAHAAVCNDAADLNVCCEHYLALDISSAKLSHAFPYAVGDTVYVLRDDANQVCTTAAESHRVVPYTINEISILKHLGHTVESVTLNSIESSNDYIRVDGLDKFLELFGRVFFTNQKDAECAVADSKEGLDDRK